MYAGLSVLPAKISGVPSENAYEISARKSVLDESVKDSFRGRR